MQYRRRTFLIGLAATGGLALAGCKLTPARPAEAGTKSAPSGAAPPGRILFVKDGQLWQWRNGDVSAIASHARFADPAWSPDGAQFAVVQRGEHHSDVFVYDAETMRNTQITENWSGVHVLKSGWARRPTWAPNGAKIAYASDFNSRVLQGNQWVPTSDVALWVADVPGGNQRKILEQAPYSGGVDWPTWSPDGDAIAYTVTEDRRTQIEVLTLDTGRIRTITEVEGGAYDACWSPDGQRLALVYRDGREHVIGLVDPDGENLVPLVRMAMGRAPTWSPDGRYLAYVALADQHFDLFAIPVPEGTAESPPDPVRLTENQRVEAQSGISWAI